MPRKNKINAKRKKKSAGTNKNNNSGSSSIHCSPAKKRRVGIKRQLSEEYATSFDIPREKAREILNANPILRQNGQLEQLRQMGSFGLEMFRKAYIEADAIVPKTIAAPPITKCAACHKQPTTPLNMPCNHRHLCLECSLGYRERNNNICPVCKNPSKIDMVEETKATTTTCEICYNDWESDYILKVTDNCDHYLCIGCMTRSFKEVASKDVTFFKNGGIECPMPNCKHITVDGSFNLLVNLAKTGLPDPQNRTDQTPFTDIEMRKCRRFMQQSRIPSTQRITCINPLCQGKDEDGELYIQDVGEGKDDAKFICNYCQSEKFALCCKCKEKWHPNFNDCDDARKSRNSNSKSLNLIKASSKPCPKCKYPTTRYHSHGCHHIKPNTGCVSCGHHWCYVCSGDYRNCGCKYQGASSCDRVRTKKDVVFNEAGWPVSVTCRCPICPDCRVGKPCRDCGGDCPVCQGIVPPGNMKVSEMWKDNDGIITKKYDDGSVYEGQMKDGKSHGKGTYTWGDDGAVYVGEWKDCKRNGNGKMTYADGEVYVGEYKDDKQDGKGTYTWGDDGAVYVGDFKDGKMHGKGTCTYADGEVYDGDWKDDKRDGKGTYTCNSGPNKGDVYVGEWKDDKRNGYGKWTNADGSIYHDGMWKDGKRVW